ncbi:hypothetical protein J8Z24_21625 (plasmid) [Pseudoalteromonas sp. SCSIO 43201]|uniref:hypothetical protein n=1 Tax=Pseudoalteromonas sp. SCSIO 43201 TaxID=2822842 RepID=UPI002075A920|nr:hypothetical protein [Pseudoalteromonas sp. SCSIO 43201]USD31112.1 hypothetical protein J8Z24_21625 [Pseudoalteromonas sp. SCSIO 43201]
MTDQLPDGISQRLNELSTQVLNAHPDLQTLCDISIVNTRQQLIADINTISNDMKSQMRQLGTFYTAMSTNGRAVEVSNDEFLYQTIGGMSRLFASIANGEYFEPLRAPLFELTQLSDCNAIASQLSNIRNTLYSLKNIAQELLDFAKIVNELLSTAMQHLAQLMMEIGQLTEPNSPFEHCFTAVATYSQDIKQNYFNIQQLQAGLEDGSIDDEDIGLWATNKARHASQLSERLIESKQALSGPAQQKLETEIERFVANNSVQPNEPIPSVDFSSQSWRALRGEWQWLGENEVVLSDSSYYRRGYYLYNDINDPDWRGSLTVHLKSTALHRYAAGFCLGYDHEEQLISIVKRGIGGVMSVAVDQVTFNTPTNYVPLEDNSSGQSFQTWSEIEGVELKLISDDSGFSVLAREVNTDTPWDQLHFDRAEFAELELGLITFGQEIQFELISRVDAQ